MLEAASWWSGCYWVFHDARLRSQAAALHSGCDVLRGSFFSLAVLPALLGCDIQPAFLAVGLAALHSPYRGG
eukprot:1047088-Alexandrium_andersonii.AAC.1